MISNVSVVVKVMEENGTRVPVTEDPNASGAKFFIRVSNKQNISDVAGAGTISPATSAVINWPTARATAKQASRVGAMTGTTGS